MKVTIDGFLNDVKNHEMKIEHDDGVFRCLRFGVPDSLNKHFRITTWPNHLCISGDMGTFVFKRLHDMFRFFRVNDLTEANPDYWIEKMESEDIWSGRYEYSEDLFVSIVKEQVDEWICEAKEDGITQEVIDQLKEYTEDFLSCCDSSSEDLAREAISDFCFTHPDNECQWEFTDFWEVTLHKTTAHCMWCLFAIAWGIQMYDKSIGEKK